MAYRGSGPPAIIHNHAQLDLTAVDKGGRDETFTEEGRRVRRNLRARRIVRSKGYRFAAKYRFSDISSATMNTLISIKNSSKDETVKVVPHSDVPQIAFECHIERFEPQPYEGGSQNDSVEIEFVAAELVPRIPSLDQLISGTIPTRIGVLSPADINALNDSST